MPPEPQYSDPEEFRTDCEAYFSTLGEKESPTITGLALHLGFCSRQSLYDYGMKPMFSYVVKWARLMVENGYEKMTHGTTPTGAIFVLKNMGWKDNMDHTSSDRSMSPARELTEDEVVEEMKKRGIPIPG